MTEREIFLAAIERPDSARTAYLDEACGTDSDLRRRVQSLLDSHEGAGSFLGRPIASPPDSANATTRAFTPDLERTAARVPSDDDEEALGFLAPATRPDSLGRIGHYEVLQVLGRGGFGIVFRAFDDVLQRVVAVKVMTPQLAATSPARKRFLREAQSSAQVRHENVVQVFAVEEKPLPFLVMEFIPGETLQQRLDRTGPVDAAETVRIGRQIAEGLAAAHATDLIHRDIKPGNVLLEAGQGRVKITDFGLARAADDASISQSGIIAGTPMYMAPEQALGRKLDQRADLFSLGSVLYQMVAGRPPFRANGTMAVLKRVAEDAPRSIREIVPETPQWLCDIIAKLHAKDPDDRFQSAREVADILSGCEEQLKSGNKVKAVSRIPSALKPAKRRFRWQWGLVPVAAVIFAWIGMQAIPSARMFSRGEGEIELATDSAWPRVFVRKGGPGGESYELSKGTRIELPSGVYTVEPPPGRTIQEWRIASTSVFSTTTMEAATESVEIDLSRGERVAIRAWPRAAPQDAPVIAPAQGGSPDYALDFAAPAAHVAFPGLKLASSEPMTIEAYVTVRDNNPSLWFNMRTPNHIRVTLGSTVGFWVGSNTSVQRAQTSEGLPVGRRVHLACVCDGKRPSLFIDGIRQNASLTPVKFSESEETDARLGSGVRIKKTDNMFNGKVDEFRISTVTRYKGNFIPQNRFVPDKDTLALYHCDEGEGDVLKDSSGNGHHGRIAGATWVSGASAP